MNYKQPVIIICTKDRPKDMCSLLDSIKIQTLKPSLIIIVDGSDNPIDYILGPYKNLNLDYVQVRPPSLPKQRNVGISRLPDECDWVGFLDDDLVLEENSLEKIMENSQNKNVSKELVGMAMIINNCEYPKFSIARSILLMDSPKGGSFTLSGCPTMYRNTTDTVEVEWLSGGVTFWRKKIFNEFKFDEWFSGTGYMEDIDFSYRVSRKYSLASCGQARCFHYHHSTPNKKLKTLGSWQVTSWWYFADKMGFNKLYVLWSLTGLALSNFLNGLFKFELPRLYKFTGNILGISKVLSGKALVKNYWQK